MSKADRDRRYSQSEKGKETQRKKNKKYRESQKGKEASRRNTLDWRKRNPEEARIRDERFRKSEHGKEIFRIKEHKYRSRKKNLPATLTIEEWKHIIKKQGNKCNICNISFEKVKPTQDHIIPVAKGGPYTKENIQALCGSCNSRKRDR